MFSFTGSSSTPGPRLPCLISLHHRYGLGPLGPTQWGLNLWSGPLHTPGPLQSRSTGSYRKVPKERSSGFRSLIDLGGKVRPSGRTGPWLRVERLDVLPYCHHVKEWTSKHLSWCTVWCTLEGTRHQLWILVVRTLSSTPATETPCFVYRM